MVSGKFKCRFDGYDKICWAPHPHQSWLKEPLLQQTAGSVSGGHNLPILPSSVATATSVKISKTQMAKVWTESPNPPLTSRMNYLSNCPLPSMCHPSKLSNFAPPGSSRSKISCLKGCIILKYSLMFPNFHVWSSYSTAGFINKIYIQKTISSPVLCEPQKFYPTEDSQPLPTAIHCWFPCSAAFWFLNFIQLFFI